MFTDPSDTDNANLNGSVPSRMKPVLEVVDIIFRPFRPPSIMVVDFFKKPNSSSSAEESGDPTTDSSESNMGTTISSDGKTSGSNEVNSKESNGGIISSIDVDSAGHESNSGARESSRHTGIFSHKPVIGMTMEQANNPATTQKQFTEDNEDNDDARKMSGMHNTYNLLVDLRLMFFPSMNIPYPLTILT